MIKQAIKFVGMIVLASSVSFAFAHQSLSAHEAHSAKAKATASKKAHHRRHARRSHSRKININTAGLNQLARIKGISRNTAKHIIRYRRANGPFKSVDDLRNVKYISNYYVNQNYNMLERTIRF